MGRSDERLSWLLAAGIALISVATWPVLPVRGAQLSDLVCAAGAALVLAMRPPPLARMVGLGSYALAACLAGGSLVRLAGYGWVVVLALAVSVAEPRLVRRALVVAALIGALTGLAGAVLYFAGKPTGLLNIAGDLVPGNYPRIRGTMMRANALAGLLATALFFLGDVPRRWRIAATATLLLALVFTFSRTWIALAAAAAVAWLALHDRHTRGRDLAAAAVVALAIAVMLAVSWLNIRLDPTRPWDIEIVAGAGTRWIHLRDALATIAAHPLGVGAGGTATADGWDAHFTLANIAALVGIPAALAITGIVSHALVRAIRAARGGNGSARAIAATLLLFCLDALARDIEDQRALWVVVGLAVSSCLGSVTRPSTAS